MFPEYDANLRVPFPSLTKENHTITSPIDPSYNCIAWAVEGDMRFWWPDIGNQYYWPEDVPRVADVPTFIEAFETVGYNVCDNGTFEQDYEKIVLYLSDDGKPTHAARLLKDSLWTSKLGSSYDISHDFSVLNGEAYGEPMIFFKKFIGDENK